MKSIPLIEYHVTNHCNLNCTGCAHFAPLSEPWYANVKDFEKDIKQLLTKVEIEQLILFGGEPFLHPTISDFFIMARKLLPNTKISVLTNGVLLIEKLGKLKNILVDNNIIVDVTCYPINVKYNFALKLLKQFNIPYHIYNDLEPIKTLRKHILCHERKSNDFDCLMIRSKSVQLKDGKLYICPLQAYIDIFNCYFNENFVVDDDCILDIYKSTDNEIVNFFFKKNSFCEFCREPIEGNVYSNSKKEKSEWMEI